MALVAYDYDSDDSEHADEGPEDKTNSGNVILNKQEQLNVGDNIKIGAFVSNGHSTVNTNINDKTNENETNSISSSMFATLPKTHGTDNKNVIHEDKIEDFIPKVNKVKEKQKVKITIPSLSQFEGHEDDLPKKQKIQPSAKGSSLLSLLPPVKAAPLSNKSFIPNSVAQKSKNVPATTKSFVPHSVKKRAELKNKPSTSKIAVKAATSSSDIESDDDFELPESFDDEMWQKVCGRPKPKQIIQEETYEERAEEVNIAPEAAEPYSGLDNEAFKELVGKKRGRDQNINVIDIHEEDILPEKDIWMVKSITDPEQVPKPVVENPVDPTRKRKHHITYLAEQAKANEQELANQWSASKFTRNQTRAKYGF